MCLLSKDYLSLISNLLEMKYRWLPPLRDSKSKVKLKLISSLNTTEVTSLSEAKGDP